VRVSSPRTRSVCAPAVAIAITCSLPLSAAAQSESRRSAVPAAGERSLTTLSPASVALLQQSNPNTPPQPNTPSPPPDSGKAFFKTGKGAAVLALLGAGFGYALYSKVHDEIKSPVREQ